MRLRRPLLLIAVTCAVVGAGWLARPRPTPAAGPRSSSSAPRETDRPSARPEAQPMAADPLWSAPRSVQGKQLHRLSLAARLAAAGRATAGRVATVDGTTEAISSRLRRGARVVLPLFDGTAATAQVNFAEIESSGWLRAGGELLGARRGSFALGVRGAELRGRILFPEEGLAYEVSAAAAGSLSLRERLLSELICSPWPLAPAEPASAVAPPLAAQPIFSSRPSASAVLYLDFDGETVIDADWNNGNPIAAAPANVTSAQIEEIWQRVKEDFLPFDVDVTTDVRRYDNAPVGRRMRCIVTPSSAWYGAVGGVAYVNSFRDAGGPSFSATIPCWVFNTSVSGIAETISHELGHTLGLYHDGTAASSYYTGHGSGSLSWGPIMGASFSRTIVQWSKGEYAGANNQAQDDVAIIASTGAGGNGFGFIVDEAGNSRAAAAVLARTGDNVAQTGVISSSADIDYYALTVTGYATITVAANPATISPNLDIGLELQDANGTVLQTSNPDQSLAASIATGVPAGSYFLKIQGVGRGNPLVDGYSSYGSIGHYALSGSIVLLLPPVIASQPVAQTVTAGSTLAFAVSASGAGPFTYQWRKNGTPITGATGQSLSLEKVSVADEGAYSVLVTNVAGSVASANAALTVLVPPAITAHPQAATVNAGSAVSFFVTATGTAPLTYSWRKNGTALSGATTSSLALSAVQPADTGSYSVVVVNRAGSADSHSATLTVNVPIVSPAISAQPLSLTINLGAAASFSVTATGGALSYQWRKNGTPIAGATVATFTLPNVRLEDAANYDVLVANSVGSITSGAATLTVRVAPTITAGPQPQSLAVGANAMLSVTAAGTAPLVYQWTKNGATLAGATGASLALANVQLADAGSYAVTVSNGAGVVSSAAAALNVYPTLPYAAHVVPAGGYRSGANVTVTCTLAYAGAAAGLGWHVLLPAGWTLVSATGEQGDVRPAPGTASLLEWAWTSPPPASAVFSYTLAVPAAQTGDAQLAAVAVVRQAGQAAAEVLAKPDPLVIPRLQYHSADTDFDFKLSLFELTRVIELYNTRSGTNRTGCYKVDASGEDGFARDGSRAVGSVSALSRFHSADTRGAAAGTPRDGAIDLFELTRVIELYNYRVGTSRTGQYRLQTSPPTEDGFAAGP